MSASTDILTWWAARMTELLPGRQPTSGLQGIALIADARPGLPAVTLSHRRGRHETPARPTPPRRGTSAALRLPEGAVLERKLVLPLAAEPELPRVVAYEIDRISPFAPAEVAWTHTVEHRDRQAARLHVCVALLPRQAIAPALATLRDMGLQPGPVLAPRAAGGLWRIGLDDPAKARPAWQTPALRLATATCALLAVATAATPFLTQQHALDQTEAAIARLRPAVEQATELRRRIADGSSGTDAVIAETARLGQALAMIATLATLLPDDTYLTSLAIRQRVLTMSGRSAAAARLIPLLAADPAIRNAAFAAPVTRAEGPRGDVFSIRAEFGP